MRQQFKNTTRTYASWKNAKKVIDGLIDGNFAWMIASTEEGRFFPVVMIDLKNSNFHYFIDKGCCVQVI
jgi:hypothetical protein